MCYKGGCLDIIIKHWDPNQDYTKGELVFLDKIEVVTSAKRFLKLEPVSCTLELNKAVRVSLLVNCSQYQIE